ncbi:MAG: bile acid:sodium symporter family protein [Saprospiraceae bacterium]|nr:bile acid:sodium symporter family protein [Saprospiraceae bacterium]MDW8229760.1 bile acid:sodium symporter family protein [Saprospiraceae bacterium]
MHPVDTLRIRFDADQLALLNVVMAFLMFSVALDIRIADFRQVFRFPRAIGVGLVAQYLLFPLMTLGLIALFRPPVSMALGMVLVGMCPSGNMTNFLVHFARGNTALSVTFNAIVILLASVVTPLGFLLWSKAVPGAAALRRDFDIGFGDMALIIVQLILLPLLAGMALTHYRPQLVARIRGWVQRISLILFFGIILAALWGNRDHVVTYVGYAFVLVLLHNGLGLGIGYALGRAARLPEADSRALAFETGIHNTALGLLLIFRFFNGLGGMALIAAWWGIWDLVTGISLAWWWRRSTRQALALQEHTSP